MRIACLHTAASNIAVFDDAAEGLAVTLDHHVRADLLAEAEARGGLTEAIRAQTEAVLAGLAATADGVLLTCSTLGPAATGAALRVDAALAAEAQSRAGPIVVLCAVRTTMAPTRALFAGPVEMRLVPGAWALFQAGDRDGYLDAVAAAADAAYAGGAGVVALAQASMAGAASRCSRGTPLTSPRSGLQAILASGAHAHA